MKRDLEKQVETKIINMNFLQHLKRNDFNKSCRWIVKYDKEELIREIKQVYKPSEYSKMNNPRELYNKNQLIKIIENDKEKRRSKAQ